MTAGRPSKLTPELAYEIVSYINAGNYPEIAAEACGIGKSTFYRWLEKGREEPKGKYGEFWEAVKKAKAQSEARNVMIIERAAEKTWQAAAWYLERTCPDRWGLKRNIEVTDKEVDVPVEQMTEEELKIILQEVLKAEGE